MGVKGIGVERKGKERKGEKGDRKGGTGKGKGWRREQDRIVEGWGEGRREKEGWDGERT